MNARRVNWQRFLKSAGGQFAVVTLLVLALFTLAASASHMFWGPFSGAVGSFSDHCGRDASRQDVTRLLTEAP